MFTTEEFLKTKCLRGMVKLRIERGEYREALEFVRNCIVYNDITEVYKVFKVIKEDNN